MLEFQTLQTHKVFSWKITASCVWKNWNLWLKKWQRNWARTRHSSTCFCEICYQCHKCVTTKPTNPNSRRCTACPIIKLWHTDCVIRISLSPSYLPWNERRIWPEKSLGLRPTLRAWRSWSVLSRGTRLPHRLESTRASGTWSTAPFGSASQPRPDRWLSYPPASHLGTSRRSPHGTKLQPGYHC